MPSLPSFLPAYERVDFCYCFGLVELIDRNSALKKGIHVKLSVLGTLAEKLEDSFDPAHQFLEESIVVEMNFMNKFIEVMLMALAEVDEGLNCLVRICGDVLLLTLFDDLH
jgi:hypothetical protein